MGRPSATFSGAHPKLLILLLGAAVIVSTTGAAAEEAQPKPKADHQLVLDGKTYDVVLGQPVKVTTAKGEEIELVFRKKDVLEYEGHGVKFRYGSRMTVSADKEPGVTTITAECNESPMAMIQIYKAETTPEEVAESLVDGFRTEFKARGAKVVETDKKRVKRTMASSEREGAVLELLFAGQHMRIEVFAFKANKAVVAVIFQHDQEEAKLAQTLFQTISESLQTVE